MNANSYDVLDADQPIPLGRASTPPACPEAPAAVGPTVTLSPAAVVPHVGNEPPPATCTSASATVVVTPEGPASVTPGVTVPGADPPPPVASRQPTVAPAQPADDPMASLRCFRLEPIPVEQAYGGRRDLVRFLVQFALVMAFVYALIVAFVLLVAHVRGTPA